MVFELFRKKAKVRKTVAEWESELIDYPKWQLENIVVNPGEFVSEMRQAATEILQQRERS